MEVELGVALWAWCWQNAKTADWDSWDGAFSLLFLHLVCLCCGPNRIRTYDPLLVRQVL